MDLLQHTVEFVGQAVGNQTRCAKAQINLGKGRENQAILPCLVVRKGRKSRIQTQNSSRKALFHDEKEKSRSPSTASDKIGPVNEEPNCTFLVDQSCLNFQIAEIYQSSDQWWKQPPNLLQTQVLIRKFPRLVKKKSR